MQLALVEQIESVEKEFPQQHSPPSNSGTTPQKPYDALHTSQFQSSKNSAGLPLSVHAQYNTIYRRVNRIALQFRLHCDELYSTARYQCTTIMQSNICNIATQHITIVHSVQQSLYQ